jgi:hypothetical protein
MGCPLCGSSYAMEIVLMRIGMPKAGNADILVVPHALGQRVSFVEGEGPRLDAPVYETITRVRQDLPPAVALLGFCGAPWTLANATIQRHSAKHFTVPGPNIGSRPGGQQKFAGNPMAQDLTHEIRNLRLRKVRSTDARWHGMPTSSYTLPQAVPFARWTEPRSAARYERRQFAQRKLDGPGCRGA